MKTKAIRVDPGMFYGAYQTADLAVAGVLKDAQHWGANTIFVFAFSPVYGAYYPAQHPGSWKNSDFGDGNFLGKLTHAANAVGVKVVASIHLNWFEKLAAAHPDWVALRQDLTKYSTRPFGEAHPIYNLSAHVPAFGDWLEGLLNDLVQRVPGLHGLEACEATVAESAEQGQGMPDFHPLAKSSFLVAHPGHTFAPSDPLWASHRSAALTNLHRRLKKVADTHGMTSYAIHDLSTQDGSEWLTTSLDYANGCGFDWDALVAAGFTPILSAIWQQRAFENQTAVPPKPFHYLPIWTASAAQQWATRYPAANRMLHVEVTPWIGAHPKVTPTPDQFGEALGFALSGSQGTTVYSYDQLKVKESHPYKDNAYADALRSVYSAG